MRGWGDGGVGDGCGGWVCSKGWVVGCGGDRVVGMGVGMEWAAKKSVCATAFVHTHRSTGVCVEPPLKAHVIAK